MALNQIQPLVALCSGRTHEQQRRPEIWHDDLLLKPAKDAGYETWVLGFNRLANGGSYAADRLPTDIKRVRANYKIKGGLALAGVGMSSAHAANIYGALAGELHELYFIGLGGRFARGTLRPRDWRTLKPAADGDTDERNSGFVTAIDYFRQVTLGVLNEHVDYKTRMHLVHPLLDPVVPRHTQLIEGVDSTPVRTIGHGLGIFAASRLLPQLIRQLEHTATAD